MKFKVNPMVWDDSKIYDLIIEKFGNIPLIISNDFTFECDITSEQANEIISRL
jgi:hypothetical protein